MTTSRGGAGACSTTTARRSSRWGSAADTAYLRCPGGARAMPSACAVLCGPGLVPEVDEGQPRAGVVAPLQVARRLLHDDLERRPHVALQQVAAVRAAVAAADHDVAVHLRLLAVERDDAEQREHLDLLGQRNALVLARLAVEVAQRHVAERADGGDLAGPQPLAAGEGGQALHDLLALVEDHDERPLGLIEQQPGLHVMPSPRE